MPADAAARQQGAAAAQELGAVRSDIVAALQRRSALLVGESRRAGVEHASMVT